ncbi:MAG: MBL fold metallo-hydrolase [Saprospiraceae bacterium]
MKITFLGTGTSQGIPVIGCDCEVCRSTNPKDKRLRCAAYVQEGDTAILIDSGPDIRSQLLRGGIRKLNGVLLTHEHYDHTGGLDDLRPFSFMQNEPVLVYAQKDVLETLLTKYDYAFGVGSYPGAPRFKLNEVGSGIPFKMDEIQVIPWRVFHGDLGILGYKFDNKLMYITDANELPDETIRECKGIRCLIINALHHRPHHAHFTLEQTLKTINIIHPESAYIIHMSHHMGLHETLSTWLPPNVHFAFDSLSLNI